MYQIPSIQNVRAFLSHPRQPTGMSLPDACVIHRSEAAAPADGKCLLVIPLVDLSVTSRLAAMTTTMAVATVIAPQRYSLKRVGGSRLYSGQGLAGALGRGALSSQVHFARGMAAWQRGQRHLVGRLAMSLSRSAHLAAQRGVYDFVRGLWRRLTWRSTRFDGAAYQSDTSRRGSRKSWGDASHGGSGAIQQS